MKFNNLEELVKHVLSEGIDFSNTDISFANQLSEAVVVQDIAPPTPEKIQVRIKTFFDSPKMNGIFEEENIIFVESVAGNKNICGAGKVNILGREILTNLCESDGTAYVKLSIDLDGKILENVLFKLQASTPETVNTIRIRKDLLND